MDRSRIELARDLKRAGYNEREVADRIGVNVSTLRVALYDDKLKEERKKKG